MSGTYWIYIVAVVLLAIVMFALFYNGTKSAVRIIDQTATYEGGWSKDFISPPPLLPTAAERRAGETSTTHESVMPEDGRRHETLQPSPGGPPYPMHQYLRIRYSKNVDLKHYFTVVVEIAPRLAPVGDADLDTIAPKHLDFDAQEATPTVQVELKFKDGDFDSLITVITKEMSATKSETFDFKVKPLKAEECDLVVMVSYVPQGGDPVPLCDDIHLIIQAKDMLFVPLIHREIPTNLAVVIATVINALVALPILLLLPSNAQTAWQGVAGSVLSFLAVVVAPQAAVKTASSG